MIDEAVWVQAASLKESDIRRTRLVFYKNIKKMYHAQFPLGYKSFSKKGSV